MVRKLIAILLLALVGAGAYASGPLIAAWEIREAVRSGDTASLRDKVDWVSVRHSLRSSLAETRKAIGEITSAAGVPRPGLWHRLKAAAMPFVADPLIERYVTPEGAPRLYAWRQTWRARIQAVREAARAPAGLVAASVTPVPSLGWLGSTPVGRVLDLWERVERWAFVSPTRLEIELADRVVSGRTWHAVMEMQGLAWRLTAMKVADHSGNPGRARGFLSVFR